MGECMFKEQCTYVCVNVCVEISVQYVCVNVCLENSVQMYV